MAVVDAILQLGFLCGMTACRVVFTRVELNLLYIHCCLNLLHQFCLVLRHQTVQRAQIYMDIGVVGKYATTPMSIHKIVCAFSLILLLRLLELMLHPQELRLD